MVFRIDLWNALSLFVNSEISFLNLVSSSELIKPNSRERIRKFKTSVADPYAIWINLALSFSPILDVPSAIFAEIDDDALLN